MFANCIPVKGYKRSIICDLQNERFIFIPNELFRILNEYNEKTFSEIKEIYSNEYDEIVDSYFEYLLKNGMIFICNKEDLKLFPKMDLSWHDSSVITNSIIEVNSQSKFGLKNIFSQLDELLCKNLQLNFYYLISKKELIELLKVLDYTNILNTQFILPNNDDFNESDYDELFVEYNRLSNIFIYKSNDFKVVKLKNSGDKLVYIKEDLLDFNTCGYVHPNNFNLDIRFFTESLCYNNCLNRKISIDVKGNIKNCPNMEFSYGNVDTIKLSQIVEQEKFKGLWMISKDKIQVCKDCEFRYICPDCRTNVKDLNDIYSKPYHCNYDPYKAEGF